MNQIKWYIRRLDDNRWDWRWHLWYRWLGYSRIQKWTVSASARPLRARWSAESVADMRCYHNLDAEHELGKILKGDNK